MPSSRSQVSHAETTAAPPAAVWSWYADPGRWPRWDTGLAAVELDGAFASDTRGRVTLPGGRRGRLRLHDVEPGTSFTDVVSLPLLRITTAHTLTAVGPRTRIEHTVALGGALARLFPRLMSQPVRRALPVSVARLARLAARETVA